MKYYENGGIRVKKGYKNNTAVFGSDAERYVSRLFLMGINPNGNRRPDLISMNGRYKPKLSIEVKSGKNNKGVLVDYQLHYAINSERDYEEFFGEQIKTPGSVLPGINLENCLSNKEVAYYYDLIDRVDGLKSEEMLAEFGAINIKWGNQIILPHEYAFYSFAVARSMRTKENISNVIEYLRDLMKSDFVLERLSYKSRKDSQSWQNLHGRDALAIFHNDESIATEPGKKRIELLREIYPAVESLKRIQIKGPNDTQIYILAEPEHVDLFDVTLRETVDQRVDIINKISRARIRCAPLVKRIDKGDLFIAGKPLKDKDIIRLNNAMNWTDGSLKDRMILTDEIPF